MEYSDELQVGGGNGGRYYSGSLFPSCVSLTSCCRSLFCCNSNDNFNNEENPFCCLFGQFTDEKRNSLTSYSSGLLFAIAWWMLIDANVLSFTEDRDSDVWHGVILWWFYVPGIISTIALIMVNIISYEAISGNGFLDDSSVLKARIWLFISFILAFGGLLGSGWILFAKYVIPSNSDDGSGSGSPTLPEDKWPGVALFLQNIFIFLSAIILRFGRKSSS